MPQQRKTSLQKWNQAATVSTHCEILIPNKYDTKIRPFWNAEHMDMSDDVAKYWHSIQGSKRVDMKPILDSLFDLGVPKYESSIFPEEDCLKCAVVGNSNNLLESAYGQTIDSHDVVIRCNQGPTAGFEKDVGSKTTHRLIYPESATEFSNETSLTLVPFKPRDVEWLRDAITTGSNIGRTYRKVPRWIKCNVSKIAIIHPDLMRHVYTSWLGKQGRYPSTGAIAVGLALQLCDKVDIYGFGADKNGGWKHYFEKLSDGAALAFKKAANHNGDKEHELLEKLASEGIAQVYRGPPV